jgi:hypothetical protein
MKPFVINRNTWHYKLNKNFFNVHEHRMDWAWEPRHNNFCSYWRATVFRVIAACFIIAFIAGALYFIGAVIYYYPIDTFIILSTAIGFFAFLILAIFISEKLQSVRSKREPKPESLLMQRYRAHKSKICPMVEYSNDY